MHVPKKRVLLGLALAVMAVLLLAPAAAMAWTGPGIVVVGQPTTGGFIGSTAVDVELMTNAPTSAYWSLNSRNVTAVDAYAPADESASTAYTLGAYVKQDAYALKGTAPADGDVMEIRVSFWKDLAQTQLVVQYTVQVTYTTAVPMAQATIDSPTDFGPSAVAQFGVPWYDGWNLYAHINVIGGAPLGAIFWTVDGKSSSYNNPGLPYDTYIGGKLNGGAGNHEKDGLHNLTVWARDASTLITGPKASYDFGVDTKAPLITVEGIEKDWLSGRVTVTATYSDPGGSGIDWMEGPELYIYDDQGNTVAYGYGWFGGGASGGPGLVSFEAKQDPLNPYKVINTITFDIPNNADGADPWTVDVWAADFVGNERDMSFEFGVDLVAPNTTYTASPANAVTDAVGGGTWTNKPVTMTFSAVDVGLSGVDYTEYIVSTKASDPAPQLNASGTKGTSVTIGETADKGIVRVWYRSVDKAGNKEAWHEAWVWFDNVAPVIAVPEAYTDTITAWMNDDFSVKLTATDPNSDLLVPGIQFKVPNWALWASGNPSYPFADWSPGSQSPAWVFFDVYPWGSTWGTNDGIYTLMVKVSDVAGNEATADYTVKVDTRAPKSDGASGWIKGGEPYVITATDQASGSGVAVTWYRVDQATKWTAYPGLGPADPMTQAPISLETPVTITGANGSVHTVDFFSIDNSTFQWWNPKSLPFPGNPEGQVTWTGGDQALFAVGYQTRTVKIDSAAPTTSVVGNDDEWHKTAVTLFFTGADAESGVAYTEWSLDGTNWTKGTQAVVSKNGVVTVSYRSVDMVGNVEATKTVVVKVATKAPVAKAWPATAKAGKKVALRYRVSAITAKADVVITIRNAKGIVIRNYNLANRATNKILTYNVNPRLKAGAYRIVVTAVDEAGNIQSARGLAKLTIKK